MSRKPGFPNSTCSIKLPDGSGSKDDVSGMDGNDENSYKKRQQLITFGHDQWGFNNWSWGVTKQDLDFVDFVNGKYSAGVVAFVSINVKSLGIHREDVGYATCVASQKGAAVHNARKCSVTNALRETLLSFGGNVASSLLAQLEVRKSENNSDTASKADVDVKFERNGNNKHNNSHSNNNNDNSNTTSFHRNDEQGHPQRKDSNDSSGSVDVKNIKPDVRSPQKQNNNNLGRSNHPMSEVHNKAANQTANKTSGPTANHNPVKMVQPSVPPAVAVPPMGVHPPVPLHPSNVSYVVQRVMPPLYSVQCATPPPSYHNAYYTEYTPWPVTYDNVERHHTNVSLNYNVPPKNFVVNGRPPNDCSRSCNSSHNRNSGSENESTTRRDYASHPVNMNGTWIKPTIFYDGFWTEQKVKKWVSEQNDRSPLPEEVPIINHNIQNQTCHSKV